MPRIDTQLDPARNPILETLGGVRREIRTIAGLRGALIVAGVLLVIVVVSFTIDRLLRLGIPARGAFLVLHVGIVASMLWRYLLRPLRAPLSDRALADMVERQRPELEDRLRSAVDFLDDPAVGDDPATVADPAEDFGLALRRSVVARTRRDLRALGDLTVVDHRTLSRTAVASTGALLAVVLLFGFFPAGTAGRWLRRNVFLDSVEWPYRTELVVVGFVEGTPRGVARGDPLTIDVTVKGELIDRASIDLEYADDRRRHDLKSTRARAFRHTHPEVREAFTFRVHGGDYRSPWYEVMVLERPRLTELNITLVFPEYIGQDPETVAGAIGELAIPRGTTLRLDGRTTKPLVEASIEFAGESVAIEVDPDEPRHLTGSLQPRRSDTLRIIFRDVEGVVPENPVQIVLRLVPDRPPTVTLRASDIGAMVSAQARIPLAIAGRDDYGIVKLDLHHDVGPRLLVGDSGEPEREPELESKGFTRLADFSVGDDDVALSHVFEVGELGIEPERRITLRVDAVDNCDIPESPNIGTSNVLEFLVVTHQKLMDDFLRRQEDQREALERVVERERVIRDALYEAVDGFLGTEGEIATDAADAIEAHARTERTLASQALSIASGVESILAEMANNRVGEADDLERIGSRVVGPLREIAADDLPRVATNLVTLRGTMSATARRTAGLELAEEVDTVIERMDAILANMVKLESFSEIVNVLRDVIKIQGESAQRARKALEQVLEEDVFESEPESEPKSKSNRQK